MRRRAGVRAVRLQPGRAAVWTKRAALRAGLHAGLCATLLAVPSVGWGHEVSVTDFLRGVERDEALAAHQRQAGVQGFTGVPYVQDVEFQIRNESFDLKRQRYTVQVSPKGFGEESASRALLGTLAARSRGTVELLRNDAFKTRYGIVLDLVEGTTLAEVYDRMASLENERIRVLERQSVTDAFDLGDILRAEASLTRHRERAEEARAMASQALARARTLRDDASLTGLDTTGLVPVDEILARLDALEAGEAVEPEGNVHVRDAVDDAATADARYRLALAETRRFIRFVEFGYDHGRRLNELEDRDRGRAHDLDRAYLVQVGFRLPWIGADRSDVVRRRAERINRQAELHHEAVQVAADLREEIRRVRALGARHAALEARVAELDIPSRLQRYSALGAADPLVILTLRQAQWENTLRREEVRFEILRRYLEAADLAGELVRRPGRNLLSAKLEDLSP